MACPRHRARRIVDTLCDLREEQARTVRAERKAARALDMSGAIKQRDNCRRRCDVLSKRLVQLQRPTVCPHARKSAEARFDAGTLTWKATKADAGAEVDGVVALGHGFQTSASRVVDMATALRVLSHLESKTAWRRDQLRASPHLAVPRFVSTHPAAATLQNLPAWQTARVALLACVAARGEGARVTAPVLRRWAARLGVAEAYVPALCHALTRANDSKK